MESINEGVYAVIRNEESYLQVKRKDGSLGLVGGRVHRDESLLEAISRELKEEVSLDPKKVERTGITQEFRSERFDDYRYVSENVPEGYERHHFFYIEVEKDEPFRAEEEYVWTGLEDLLEFKYEDRKKAVEDVLKSYIKEFDHLPKKANLT